MSAPPIVRRAANGHLLPGSNLNPGGRPRGAIMEVRERLQPYALIKLVRSEDETTQLKTHQGMRGPIGQFQRLDRRQEMLRQTEGYGRRRQFVVDRFRAPVDPISSPEENPCGHSRGLTPAPDRRGVEEGRAGGV